MNQDTCGTLIKQIHDELEKSANNAMRADGITIAQCGVLLALHEAPEQQLALKELERQLRVAQSTAAGIVSRLEQKGLTEGIASPEDKRVKTVRITSRGEECCAHARQNMQKAEDQLLSGLTETEREILLRLLKKVRDTL